MRYKSTLVTALLLAVPMSAIRGGAASSTNRALRVMSHEPGRHAMVDADNFQITVQFDNAIDPETLNSRSFSVFGRWTGVCTGRFVLEDTNRRVRFIPDKPLSAGEWVTVSLAKTIRTDIGDPLDRGFAWNFWTAAGKGSLQMQRVDVVSVRAPGESRIRTYGAYAGDLNGDGYHDFTVPNEDASDIRVFLNDGHGGYSDFEVHPLAFRSVPSTNEGADFNGDGHIDFAVGNIGSGSVSVLMGDGEGGFASPVSYQTGAGTRGLCVLDLNADGAPDIVAANRVANNLTLLLNDGQGDFGDRQPMDGGVQGETSCAAADINNDGRMDVFVGGFDSNQIAVLLGDGDGGLRFDTRISARGNAWMIAAGDINNDGNVDVVSANANLNNFAYLLGNGDGSLRPAQALPTGQFPLAIDVGDLDGDGDLEVVTSNFLTSNWTIFENDGQGRFSNAASLPASIAGSCAVLHDRDRDGDLDLTGIDEIDDLLFLFENSGATTATNNHTGGIPASFELLQSFPNPISKSGANTSDAITISFSLSRPRRMKLEVVNILGQRIATLIDSRLSAGKHSASLRIATLPPGTYFYRLSTEDGIASGKIVLFP